MAAKEDLSPDPFPRAQVITRGMVLPWPVSHFLPASLFSSLAPHWWGHTQENLDPRRQQLWPLQRALEVSGYHGDATGPSPGAPGFYPGRGWTTKTAPPLIYLYSFPRLPNIDVVPPAPR